MGAIISKLWRKRSTRDVLEKIRDQISDIEEFKQSTQVWHKKLIGYLLAYFSVLYLIAALVAYFKYFTNPLWRDFTSQLQLMTPFIVAPFIFVFLKRFLTWWYHRKIKKNEVALDKLRKEKTKILDAVMETETYKVTKELLDEFASDSEKRTLNFGKSPKISAGGTRNLAKLAIDPKGMELRRRQTTPATASGLNSPGLVTKRHNQENLGASFIEPSGGSPRHGPQQSRPTNNTPATASNYSRPPPGPPLPRPVMPRDRGYMDRVVEYLVGDGPNNRYALICRQCQSHNGMALKEEFEYIAFRCCYCHYWNPAKKQRPTAPKLEATTLRQQPPTESSSSDEERESRPGTKAGSQSSDASQAGRSHSNSEGSKETEIAKPDQSSSSSSNPTEKDNPDIDNKAKEEIQEQTNKTSTDDD
jgi:hypothetical protein